MLNKKIILLSILAASFLSKNSQAQDIPWPPGSEMGLIIDSCQSYLNAYQQGMALAYEASSLAYMSALNDASPTKNRSTGSRTNNEGILGEVRLYCANHPSDSLSKASFYTYIKLLSQGK